MGQEGVTPTTRRLGNDDRGRKIVYMATGGRKFGAKKFTKDQTLAQRQNFALACSVAVRMNNKGAFANGRRGKAIHVFRGVNEKNDFAPNPDPEGNQYRFDGIYRPLGYSKGCRDGKVVYQFYLLRDEKQPVPDDYNWPEKDPDWPMVKVDDEIDDDEEDEEEDEEGSDSKEGSSSVIA